VLPAACTLLANGANNVEVAVSTVVAESPEPRITAGSRDGLTSSSGSRPGSCPG